MGIGTRKIRQSCEIVILTVEVLDLVPDPVVDVLHTVSVPVLSMEEREKVTYPVLAQLVATV